MSSPTPASSAPRVLNAAELATVTGGGVVVTSSNVIISPSSKPPPV